jgi:hypothetical protein
MTTENHITRRAPHMERYTDITPCVVKGYPDAHVLWLKIGNQSFTLSAGGQDYFDTKEEAEWTRDMLCIALDRLQRGEDL